MIPEFPNFKKLELSDREEVESVTNKFPPYSDFNFTSMWCWDINEDMRLSKLNGNIIVRFNDYQTGEPFYSFIGDNKAKETARKLIELSIEEGIEPKLKLVPEESTIGLDEEFIVEEDRDHHDYVYDIDRLSKFGGNKLRAKRNLSNRFERMYAGISEINDLSDLDTKDEFLELFHKWIQDKSINKEDAENEYLALKRSLDSKHESIVSIGLFIDGNFAGFVINEVVHDDHAILHFKKAQNNYIGIYAYLMQKNAELLSKLNVKRLNYEQDLGISGLRLNKRSFRNTDFLKKYIILSKH